VAVARNGGIPRDRDAERDADRDAEDADDRGLLQQLDEHDALPQADRGRA
jgi:hypothetical protein